MSEMAEMWRELRAERSQYNAKRKVSNTATLEAMGIPFTSHNQGQHLVIKKGAVIVDFYPSTETWKARGGEKQKGLNFLLQVLQDKVQGDYHA